MIIFVNPMAAGGTALRKWNKMKSKFDHEDSRNKIILMNGQSSTERIIHDALSFGETDFIAAGGDGTINALLNMIIPCAGQERCATIRLGAIGLGSSNDFHKPLAPERMIDGMLCTLDSSRAKLRDVGCVTFEEHGSWKTKYFLLNASIGITAEANSSFNHPDHALQSLKKLSTPAAILYTTMKTAISFHNRALTIHTIETGEFTTNITNLAIMKSPHVSGSLRYNTEAAYENGEFSIHLCHDMNKLDLLRLFRQLSKGKFCIDGKTRSWPTASMTVSSSAPFAVEFDGEIITATIVQFNVLHKYIGVCS